ncbi:MAG: efflux RND transporter periplasmic adaptor subunit [Acidobacteriota bacterium]|nr:efflux RND transporter periplasmic adaptor subunit [Acidobacteriota bacterium]
MKHLRSTVFPLLLLLGLGACGGEGDHSGPAHEPQPLQVSTTQAQRLDTPARVELRGTVEAEQTASVSARILAMVTAVHADAGEAVKKGQLLLEIDPQTARGQLAQAEGALAQAKAGLSLAERNYERFQALREADAASELELDKARMDYEAAQGAVEQARGAVQAASAVAGDSRVVAPFTGRVARRMVEVGDLAAPGRPLLTLESGGGRRLVLDVPEGVMARAELELGDTLPVRIDARPELGELTGTVVERAPGADPMSHTFRVKLRLGDSSGSQAEAPTIQAPAELPTGSTGRAWVTTGGRSAVAVPAAAVLRQGGLSLVVVRDADGQAAPRVVTVGESLGPAADGQSVDGGAAEDEAGELVEILSGLTGEEEIAVGLNAVPALGTPLEVQ